MIDTYRIEIYLIHITSDIVSHFILNKLHSGIRGNISGTTIVVVTQEDLRECLGTEQ